MNARLTRRQILKSGAAAASLGAVSSLPASAASRPQDAPLRLTAGTRVLEVNGKPARVFGLTGPDGKPGLTLAPGRRFNVRLLNEAGRPTIIHWHGQLPPWTEDGFPWPQTPPLPKAASHVYDFAPIAGTFWMHSHQNMQEQRLMTAPLIVQDQHSANEDSQQIVLMLHDFSFRSPEDLLAGLTKDRGKSAGSMNMGSMSMTSSHVSGMHMSGMHMGGGGVGSADMGMSADLNDIAYDAFLANDRTLADPQVVRVKRGDRIRLRLINGSSATQFRIDLGALTGAVIATDGRAVRPVQVRRVPLAIAQRLDIALTVPESGVFPILAQVEGARARTGVILATQGATIKRIGVASGNAPSIDLSLERRLVASAPLAKKKPDVVHRVVLAGSMSPYAWSMNGEFWPNVTPLMVKKGQRVEIEMVNRSMMAHPMHLHGHSFQVVALNGALIDGAMRDTVLTPPLGKVRVAFDADNPGRWAFHCHNLYHMMTGMMTEVRYQGIV